MSKNLVIVESPAKAKTIKKYLGPGFEVMASYGHVRDLVPKDGAVDPAAGFAMKYQVIDRNAKHVSAISAALKNSDALYLATDPDREGEAIAWHLTELLKERKAIYFETEGKNKGCWVMPAAAFSTDSESEDNKVIVRSNGTVTYVGKDIAWLSFAITVENFTSAIGTVIFVGYLSALCRNPLHTATQFALLTALSAVGRTYLSSGAGLLAEATGWGWFFAICAIAGIPGLLLLAWLQARGHFETLAKK